MKKLGKRNNKVVHTIESYMCECLCQCPQCSCSPDNFTIMRDNFRAMTGPFGNTSWLIQVSPGALSK